MTAKLAKPKNARSTIPAVCGFCRHYCRISGGWLCEREGNDYIIRDFGADGQAHFRRTCDLFVAIGSEAQK
jgi:hypothetical protein